ncbi:MAG: hypothetical protein CL561_13340 [Alphaproteobacteria bacterium]|nr:hypothetical protein [Alphaproteobacteria bacterium]|tara:strand:+ start:5490 stop:7805 length:2316 start_codon:yes stop_codon:yes gene_type:complete
MTAKSTHTAKSQTYIVKNSLSSKFSKVFLVTTALLGIFASILFFIYAYSTQKQQLYNTIEREISGSKESASLAAYTIDKLVAKHMLDGFTRSKGIAYARIALEDGTILAQAGLAPQNYDIITTILFPEIRTFEADLDFSVRGNALRVGTLYILPDYINATQNISRELLRGLLFIILLSALIYIALRKLIDYELSSPIIALAQQISSINNRTLDENITVLDTPEKHCNDEIGYLIDNFNTLFKNLTETKIFASNIQDTLETTEAQYTAMVANTFEIFMRLSENGNIEFVNPAVKKILGYGLTELINTNILEYIEKNDVDNLQNFIAQTSTNATEENTRIFHFKTKNGEERILSCSMNNALNVDKINCLLFIARDITKSYKTEIELRQAQKLESIGKLTGGIAHDFNNILTIIINNIELVTAKVSKLGLDKDGLSPINKLLDSALNASFTGADLTHRLLAFARNQPLNPDHFNPNEKIRNILPLLERTIGKHITVSSDLEHGISAVKLDVSQFENAILNLCINARDAIPTDRKGCITIKTSKVNELPDTITKDTVQNSFVLLEIIDNGEGISPENLKKVIDPFFTTKAIGKGTGLGLSMVYGFVHQSKGFFNIISDTGEGTTIQMYFPEYILSQDEQEGQTNHAEEEEMTFDGTDKSILILEDNDTIADIIEKLLQDMSFAVTKTLNSKDAFAVYDKNGPFSLILSDVLLQGDITGFQFADQILTQNPDQKIIHMSGYTDPDNTLQDSAYNVALRKPFRKTDLVRALNKKMQE